MRFIHRSTRTRKPIRAAGYVGALLTAAATGFAPASAVAKSSGSVSVLYAGSLESLMNKSLGPAFQKATGYTFSGYPAGSKDLANEIKGKVRQGDVFISASSKVDATLSGAKNGNWISWYAPFATTKLVLGYNPSSSFAADIRGKPWYQVIAEPSFRLGFTDPTLDPKGVLSVAALKAAATKYKETSLEQIASDQSDLFPEQDLVGRLQAGQLDAGFFYTVEASAAKIPTVSLGSIHETAGYTITVLNRAPNRAGGQAFVKFLLSSEGKRLMKAVGLALIKPIAKGHGVPHLLTGVIKR